MPEDDINPRSLRLRDWSGNRIARLLIATTSLPGFLGRWRRGRPVLFAGGRGLVLATLGWSSGVARTFCPPLYRTLAARYLRPVAPKSQPSPPVEHTP